MAARREKRARRQRQAEAMPRSHVARRRTVLAFFALAAVALVARAVQQQIFERDFLQAEGADRYLDEVTVAAHRGPITDRNGRLLAMSAPVDSIAANPRLLPPDSEGLPALARALGIKLETLRQRLARHAQRRFVYLRRHLAPAQAARVMAVARRYKLPGLQKLREYRRYYPDGEIFAHVVGFTNVDDRGQEGMELAWDAELAGQPGLKRVLRDGRRQVVADVESLRLPRPGKGLVLSLDQRLQYIAYRELKAAIRRHGAKAGSIVLLDARSGEVLAMVNQPGYNPNRSRSNRNGRLLNRAVAAVFEPGSTMKPLALAAALDAGVVKADERVDTRPGWVRIGRYRFSDHHPLGVTDLRTILQKSSNVGAMRVTLRLKPQTLWDYLHGLGFGQSTGSGFPGELRGRLRPVKRWARVDQATLAFGYGLSTTALQLARAYLALANDGVVLPVSLIRRDHPPEGTRVFKAETARLIRHLLESVVSREGTAPQAAVPGYRVAGKTGTARKFGPGGYNDKRHMALFAGMAPAGRPRLVAVVVIDEPQGKKYYGGQVAAPVFSRVMGAALRLLDVPPDDLAPGRAARLAELEVQR